jgi:hypothetical protein
LLGIETGTCTVVDECGDTLAETPPTVNDRLRKLLFVIVTGTLTVAPGHAVTDDAYAVINEDSAVVP